MKGVSRQISHLGFSVPPQTVDTKVDMGSYIACAQQGVCARAVWAVEDCRRAAGFLGSTMIGESIRLWGIGANVESVLYFFFCVTDHFFFCN
jgi:hypothetical protein